MAESILRIKDSNGNWVIPGYYNQIDGPTINLNSATGIISGDIIQYIPCWEVVTTAGTNSEPFLTYCMLNSCLKDTSATHAKHIYGNRSSGGTLEVNTTYLSWEPSDNTLATMIPLMGQGVAMGQDSSRQNQFDSLGLRVQSVNGEYMSLGIKIIAKYPDYDCRVYYEKGNKVIDNDWFNKTNYVSVIDDAYKSASDTYKFYGLGCPYIIWDGGGSFKAKFETPLFGLYSDALYVIFWANPDGKVYMQFMCYYSVSTDGYSFRSLHSYPFITDPISTGFTTARISNIGQIGTTNIVGGPTYNYAYTNLTIDSGSDSNAESWALNTPYIHELVGVKKHCIEG